MKKAILIVGTLLFIAILNSCKEELDDRDKFAGTWTGNMCFARSGTEYSTTEIII